MSGTSRHILLIGLRGAGKTTLGAQLSERLALPFLDLDQATRTLLGVPTVREAFHQLGEPAFRAAEARALRQALARPTHVIALGGGTPTAPGADEMIRSSQRAGSAVVIYLRAPASVLRDRMSRADTSQRPSLTGADPLDEIEAVLTRRDPQYLDIADSVIDVGTLDLNAAADAIIAAISD